MKAVLFQVLLVLLMVSCAKDNVGIDEWGHITGKIVDSETGESVSGVNISTTPPTVAIITGDSGTFRINQVPLGSYTVQARKPGFKNNSVSVSITAWNAAQADILLEPEEEEPPAEENVLRATR
ncbi:MAG: carboxypeptidase regulatory-like domain-containing protein [Gracilimonas sp.]|nr:carboxypeptidase regulatory-like domain-containing protein [Gracilimonas sp.]